MLLCSIHELHKNMDVAIISPIDIKTEEELAKEIAQIANL